MIVNVIIPLALNEPFSYEVDKDLEIGQFVVVPFGNKNFVGLISDVNVEIKNGINLKKIKDIIDIAPLKQELIDFIKWTAEYNLIPLGNVLKMVSNPISFLKNKFEKRYILSKNLCDNNVINNYKLTPKQKLIVDFLQNTSVGKEKILKYTKVGDSVLKKLVENGVVKEIIEEKKLVQNIGNFNLNKLSMEQKKAFNIFCSSGIQLRRIGFSNFIKRRKIELKFNTFVLEGTTGSGKTEVYFHLIAKLLKNTDKQALILLPEIALTSQLISRFKKQFNFEPAVWHSEITDSKKSDIFNSVLSGDVKVVIGTRSALFLPFKDLGFIVVDEEHDPSYKQTENGCYNGRDLAIVRAKINNIPILLSSATPSLETLINIDKGKYIKIDLPSRYGNAVLPDIEIVDLKKEKLKKDIYISKILKDDLEKNLINHKQSLLFMNKRGYSPVVLCSECGEKFVCPNCSCNLSLHKDKNRLVCHHCEYFIEKPKVCSHCGSENLIDFGPGVEKIEKEIKNYFPTARTIIMASDTINTSKKLEESINRILNNEIDIIIGTQLVAKGHHFPNLVLVGILDSDASLFGGDIRASERTYQLLTQVSGRAGREDIKGKVYFQTYNPDNLILQAIKNKNKELLIDFEKQNRELGGFPPFGKMAIISIASINEIEAYRTAKKIVQKIPFGENVEVMGPAPAIISKLAKMFRFNVIVKTSRNIDIQKLLKKTILSEKYNSNVRIKIEIV